MGGAEFVEWSAFYEIDALMHKEMRTGKSARAALEMVQAMNEIHDEVRGQAVE